MNEYEALAKALLNTPQGAKVLGNLDKISGLLNKPEGRQLLTMLAGGGADALKNAAEAATKGDSDTAKKLLSSLLSTPEGIEMAKHIVELMKE